jgi:branched-chain amino acid transport system permease protein
VERGRVHGLVGPNGSGKTTLLNVISGLLRLDQGSVAVGGTDTTRAPAYDVARLGVGRTFQTPRIFEDMSIWENLEIGADFKRSRGAAAVLDALAANRVEWESQHPDLLAHAQRRLLEVIRIVAMDVEILLFDEPAAGLSPEERREFAALLRFLRDRMGKTIVIVEHDLALVWRVADRITVLDAGRVIADGPPQAIMDDPKVRALFTGAGHA